MLYTYTGTPGSGKSYHATLEIIEHIKKGGYVITNILLKADKVIDLFNVPEDNFNEFYVYLNNEDITPTFLCDFAKTHIVDNLVTLLIIDEAADMFNTREWKNADRMRWIKFFRMHRHLYYNVLLITQSRKMLDKQILWLFDSERNYRKIKEFGGIIGDILGILCPNLNVWVDIYVPLRTKKASKFFILKNDVFECYDSFGIEDIEI